MDSEKTVYARVTGAADFRQQLEQIIAAEELTAGSKQWLRLLFKLTIDEKTPQSAFSLKNLALEVYRDASMDNAASAAIGDLRRQLRLYYATPIHQSEIQFFINLRPCTVGYLGVVSPVIVTPTIHQLREDNHGISLQEFRKFLEDLCALDDTSLDDMNKRARQWCITSGLKLELRKDNEFDQLFKYFGESNQGLKLSQMHRIAEAFLIHPIMLDPLLSTEVPERGISVSFPKSFSDGMKSNVSAQSTEGEEPREAIAGSCRAGTFVPANNLAEKGYGKKTSYFIPDSKLTGTDPSFVYLVFRPRATGRTADPVPQSDDHHHPGDEWLFVLRGTVEVRFADSGIRLRLEKHCYLHFYAEQTHSAHYVAGEENLEEAHVLIIRLYQRTPNPDSRQSMRQQLWRAVGASDAISTTNPMLGGWIVEAAATRSIKSGFGLPPSEVSNRLGLARFLGRIRRKKAGKNFASWLEAVARGTVRVPSSEIPRLHTRFNVFPLLLWDFLFPSVVRHVLILWTAKEKDGTGWSHWVNLAKVVDGDTRLSFLSDEVVYRIPTRTLACSDMSIAWVELAPGRLTPENEHTGSELVIPLEGQVKVVLDGEDFAIVAVGQGIVHYLTDTKHQIHNVGNTRARVLIIRFFADSTSDNDTPSGGHEKKRKVIRASRRR
jgi:quercetin dioxygenase-like cupin family protein